jgi:NhaA family Na+:H+ antiporter
MTYFIFIVGLEIKREILVGELSTPKSALLPVVAALGGMLVPGAIYLALNRGTPTASGWGIPMATDIAFALGAIAVFGRKLPVGLRVFLSAFAIADDLGAVVIIAVFYTKEIVWSYLIICLFFIAGLALANILWIRWTLLYALLGLGIWVAVLGSGVHPTVAGFVVAMFIPAKGKYDTDIFVKKVKEIMDKFQCEEQSCGYSILLDRGHLNAVHSLEVACHEVETPLQRLEHFLHPWIAFLLLPLFAFANAGLSLKGIDLASIVLQPLTLGITLGLFLGKPIGIAIFSFLAVKTGIAVLPADVRWSHIIGAGMLGGIGFTMSLFVSGLSFASPELLNYAKLGILLGSILAAVAGIVFLACDCAFLGKGKENTSVQAH